MRRAAGLAAAVVLVGIAAAPATAQAPDRPPGRADIRIEVEAFTGVLLPGGELRLRVRVHNGEDETVEGLRILATLHRREISRFDFQRAVDDGRLGNLWESFSTDVDPVGAGSARVVQLTRTAAELGFAQPADRYGVYPMRIQVQHGGAAVDEVRTSLVLSPEAAEEPVRIAFLLPLDEVPARRPDGSLQEAGLLRAVAGGGRLSGLVGNAAGSGVPLTVATSGLLLEQVADAADGYTAVRGGEVVEVGADATGARAAARFLQRLSALVEQPHVDHVALPYGPADLVALVRHDMTGEAVRLLSEGAAAAERHTGVRPLPGVLWPPDGLDQATLAQTVGAGAHTVVLSERYLDTRLPTFSPSPLRRLRSQAGAPVAALVPDPWLEDVLRRDPGGQGRAVTAQRIVAETAAVYFERPYAPQRGLLLAPPLGWDPPRGLLRDVLDAARAAPWLEPVSLSQLAEAVERDPGGAVSVDYPSSARARELGAGYVGALRDARRALGSFSGVLAAEDDTPARFERLLLQAGSVHYRSRRASEGRELITEVAGTVGALYDAVRVVEGPVVTLAGTEGRLPVTLASDADVPVRVQVRFVGPRYDFEPPVLRDVVLPAQGSKTVAVDATALSPGGIAGIRVVVEDEAGLLELAEGTVVVRSTGLNLVALAVTAGAGLFLLTWWGRESRRRRGEATADAERSAAA